jgi:hypothetical protein
MACGCYGRCHVKDRLSGFRWLVTVALGSLAVAVPVAGAFRGRQVYVIGNCSKAEVRPSKLILACADANFYATVLRYRSYGGAVAVAQAVSHRNTCEPNCASGRFVSRAATVRLSAIKRCDGRFYYTMATVSGTPSTTWPLGNPKRCGRTLA